MARDNNNTDQEQNKIREIHSKQIQIKYVTNSKPILSDSPHMHPRKHGLHHSYRTSCSIPNVSNHKLGLQHWAYNKFRQ